MIVNWFTHWSRSLHEATVRPKIWQELMTLVHGQRDTAEPLISLAKHLHTGKSEIWYLEKVVYNLKRDQ